MNGVIGTTGYLREKEVVRSMRRIIALGIGVALVGVVVAVGAVPAFSAQNCRVNPATGEFFCTGGAGGPGGGGGGGRCEFREGCVGGGPGAPQPPDPCEVDPTLPECGDGTNPPPPPKV